MKDDASWQETTISLRSSKEEEGKIQRRGEYGSQMLTIVEAHETYYVNIYI